jgi:aarF domain-containing kinase
MTNFKNIARKNKYNDEYIQKIWDKAHEENSERMLNLCLSLRGFYLKAGQIMGTRADFMPEPYLKKLCKLQDQVPQISSSEMKSVIESELRKGNRTIENSISNLDLDSPVGCASICQVYKAIWKDTNELCAVKIQYPGAEEIMKSDLKCLTRLAEFLSKKEIRFDLLSIVKELQSQIHREFDFNYEANALNSLGRSIESNIPIAKAPKPIYVTKRLLVMSFLDGVSMLRLAETSQHVPKFARQKASKKLLTRIAEIWGYMLFKDESGEFHAGLKLPYLLFFLFKKKVICALCVCLLDPHPGNILVTPKSLDLGIIDFGQTKVLDPDMRLKFAKMVSIGVYTDII